MFSLINRELKFKLNGDLNLFWIYKYNVPKILFHKCERYLFIWSRNYVYNIHERIALVIAQDRTIEEEISFKYVRILTNDSQIGHRHTNSQNFPQMRILSMDRRTFGLWLLNNQRRQRNRARVRVRARVLRTSRTL